MPYERTRIDVVQETIDGRPRERRTERTDSRVLRLPAYAVDWRIGAEISEKARGIYKARLYSASAEARGRFSVPAQFGLTEPAERIKWGTPRLVVGVTDPGGIRSVSPLTVAGAEHAFEAGSGDEPALPGGVHVPLPGLRAAAQSIEFSFSLELAGSEAFAVAPLGSNATVTMRADWPHPSFAGRFLPLRHEIGAEGFTAQWQVSQYAAPGLGRR